MKPLFIRIEDDLERRLTDLCQREGYKKGTLLAKLIREFLERHGPSRDPVQEAKDFGVDVTLLEERLKRSPTERLKDHAQLHTFAEEARRAGRKRDKLRKDS